MPKLADVAERAGVSLGVASKVLGGKETAISIPEATRARIRLAAETLNYVPNARAKLLRNRASPLVGVLVRSLSGTFRSEFLHSLSDGMLRLGKEFLIDIHRGEEAMARRAINTFRAYRTSAVLTLGVDEVMLGGVPRMLEDGREECGPEISISFHARRTGVPAVALDLDTTLDQFFAWARAAGLRGATMAAAEDRLASRHMAERFAAAAARAGFAQTGAVLLADRDFDRLGRAMADLIIRQGVFPWGVIVSKDNEAAAIAHALIERGVEVPRQVAVMGYGNQEVARFCTPTLSTVDVLGSIPRLAAKVIDLLADLEAGRTLEPVEHLIVAPLIARQSFPQPEGR